jgi:hypothetical protein
MPNAQTTPTILVAPARFVVIKLAAAAIGLTERAIQGKIADGTWREGKEYRRGPDGRIYVDLRGVEKWVEMEAA